ncbi:MAG: LuxR C-terminal-related transcriptional regulator [Burkholderiales bacterium]
MQFRLTARELDVVEIAMTGVSNKVLCKHLEISLPTLRTHIQSIYTKVGVRSNAELIARVGGVKISPRQAPATRSDSKRQFATTAPRHIVKAATASSMTNRIDFSAGLTLSVLTTPRRE